MIRVRRLVSTLALCSAMAIAAAGCHKKVAAAAPPAAAAAAARGAGARRRRRRRRRRRPPRPRRAPLTEEEIFARKSVDQLNAEQPLDDVFFDLDESRSATTREPALQKDADWMKKWSSVAGHARRPLRLARQRRVQPGSRHPPRDGGEGLPGQPRRARRAASPWSARARSSRSATTKTSPAGSRTAAATSSLRRSKAAVRAEG